MILALAFSVAVMAQEGNYLHVSNDLANGVELKEIADRAFANSEFYWQHDHPGLSPDKHDGRDEPLSAAEAVTEIYTHAALNRDKADPLALDIVQVTIAVVESWPDCQDTFDAVRAAVQMMPGRAGEIVANVAVKRDCNCSNGGLWVDQHAHDRIRVEMRHQILDVPAQCSCSQVAMYAGVAGLPENAEFKPGLSGQRKIVLIARMTENITTITKRTTALQSKKNWECGCTDINIAATMQGINEDELRNGTYESLAQKYLDEAGFTGIVVDSFGVIGRYPTEHWGAQQHAARDNTLQRKPEVHRGDSLVLDPFHPATEFLARGEQQFSDLGRHKINSSNRPSGLFISEYIEGWNQQALTSPVDQRDPQQRNRVIELYNGSEKTIDLSSDQYFLEIYTGLAKTTTTTVSETARQPVSSDLVDGERTEGSMDPRQVIGLNGNIEPGATYVVAYNQSDETITDAANLVTSQLDFKPNETLVVRRLGGQMALNCRAQSYAYVMNYPAIPIIRVPGHFPQNPPSATEAASPN